jgi:spore coat protein U-like protein
MPRFFVGLLLCLLGAQPVAAQLALVGARDLTFGPVALGVTTIVTPSDPTRSGQFTITGRAGMQVQFRMTLPNRLNGPSGASMPVDFQAGDAFIQQTVTGSLPDYFNPGATKVFKFTTGTQAVVRLGGRVTPGASQPAGRYSNTVLATATVLSL